MAEAHIVAHAGCCLTPQSLRLLNHALVCTQGVAFDNAYGVDSLAVSPGGGLSVVVEAGSAFIEGANFAGEGMYFVSNDAPVSLQLDPADAADPRCDLVIAQVDGNATDCADAWVLTTVTGVPAPVPTCPAVPAGALLLAEVTVDAAATSVTPGDISDERVAYGLCGLESLAPPGLMYDSGWTQEGLVFGTNWESFMPSGENVVEYRRVGWRITARGLVRRIGSDMVGSVAGNLSTMVSLPGANRPLRQEVYSNASNANVSTGAATAGTAHTHRVFQSTVTGAPLRVTMNATGGISVHVPDGQTLAVGQWVSLAGVDFYRN